MTEDEQRAEPSTQFQRWDNTGDDTAAERNGREIAYSQIEAENAVLKDTVAALQKLSGKQGNTKCNGKATFLDSIMIYQSMSGDADSGTSFFTMNGGKLTSKNGHVFHVTNTSAVITLNGVEIVNEDADNILLSVCADGWNGDSNKALVKAASQKLSGSIKVGNDSVLALGLTDGSTFEGSIDGSIVNASGTVVSTETGAVSVTLDSTSTWTLTGDSYITEFNGDLNNVNRNGYTLYVNGEALA